MNLQSQIDRLHRRIRMMMAPGRVLTTDDTGPLLKGQIAINGTPEIIDALGIMQTYGFHMNPLPGTDTVALFLAGDRSNPMIVATNNREFRPRNYKPGEVGIYTDEGDTIILNRDNKLNIASKDALSMKGQNTATVDAPHTTVKGSDKISLDTPLVDASGKIDAKGGFFQNGNPIGGTGPPGPGGPAGPPGATGPAGIYQTGPGLTINTATDPDTIDVATPYLPLTGGTISGALTVVGLATLAIATVATPATADNSTRAASTAFVKAQGYATTAALAAYLPLTGGTITGTLTVNSDSTFGDQMHLTGPVMSGGGRTTEARLAPNRFMFRQTAGDETAAGALDYRGFDPNALSIVGAGTAAGSRLIHLFDNVVIPGTLAVSGATTLATATATTPATADNSTSLATTAFVKSQGYATAAALGGYLPLTGGTISGTLGVGGSPQARLYVLGDTQATPAINTAGVLPYLMLDDANTGAGAGGGIIFSAGTGAWRYAAIVGYVTSGSNNSQGDIVFSTRRVVTDATLTEAMRIRSDGVALHKAPVICTSIGSPAIGQFHMAASAAGTGYGSFWYNDANFTYLLLTANNDALGSYNSLRPFMVDNATGLIAIGHGLNITGLTQILNSSGSNVLKIQNAGGQNLQIFDDTNEHIEASTVLWINGNTHARTNFGGSISVAGVVEASGSIAGLQFDDRGGVSPTQWTWYAIGGKGTLYNNVNGDVFSVGVAGALTTFGNVNGVNNKFFFWADTTGALKQGFGMSSDNNYYISDGARYIIMNGWTVPISDSSMKLGEPGRAWNIVQSYAFTNSSDRRLKRDIEALPADCLGLVRAIDPVQFRWRQGLDSDRQHWGFVAQDVGAAMKAAGIDFGGHVIGDDPDATEALSVTEMIAVLWRAVQELAGRTA